MEKAVAFYNNERPHMSLNNMTPRQAASCMGKIQKKWTNYREKYLENLEIQEGACTFAPQTLKTIERLSAEPIQQKQGLRENHSTFSREVQCLFRRINRKHIALLHCFYFSGSGEKGRECLIYS